MEDALFTSDPPPATTPPNGNSTPTPETTPDPAAALAAQAEQITAQGAQISELTSTVGSLVQGIQAHQAQQASPPPVESEGPPETFNDRLIANPQGAIEQLIADQLKGITPVLGGILGSGAAAITAQKALLVDQEFGAGAWAEFFEKPMDMLQEKRRTTNPASLMDQSLLDGDINSLKGIHLDKLVDFRTKSRETVLAKAKEGEETLLSSVLKQIPNRTNLTGGIGILPNGDEVITPELEGFLKERSAATGTQIDPKTWVKKMDYGSSLLDYEAKQLELKKEEGDSK